MYYHDIAFLAQSKFFIYSLLAGMADGVLCLFFCSKSVKESRKFVFDFLFCILSCFIIVIVNIAFQDAALRIYEVLAFILGLFLVVFTLKKRTDKVFVIVKNHLNKHFFTPVLNLFKLIINKIKLLLKKLHTMLYNLYSKFKEIKKRDAKKRTKKEKKEKAKAST